MQLRRLGLRGLLVTVGFTALATACGGPPRPKITHVSLGHNGAQGASWDITYNGNAIDRITITQSDGTTAAILDFSYSDNKISSIDATNPNDSTQDGTMTLSYNSDGQVSQMRGTYGLGSGQGTMVETTAYEYSNGRVDRVTDTQDGQQNYSTRFRWDSKNRVSSIVTSYPDTGSGSGNETVALTYDDGNNTLQHLKDTLTSTSNSQTTSDTTAYSYSYNSDTKIDQVAVDGAQDTYQVDYNSDNRVDTVTETSGADTYTTTYTYGDGDFDGLMPTPGMPGGRFFDMEGSLLDNFYPLNTSDSGLFGG